MNKLLDKYEQYEQEIMELAEQQCKNKYEWQLEDIARIKAKHSELKHKSVSELREEYQMKLYSKEQAEQLLQLKLNATEERIARLEARVISLSSINAPKRLRKAKNQLNWAKQNLCYLSNKLSQIQLKLNKYEYLYMKWTGIWAKILTASVATTIDFEKQNLVASKYGYGVGRGYAKFMHTDED